MFKGKSLLQKTLYIYDRILRLFEVYIFERFFLRSNFHKPEYTMQVAKVEWKMIVLPRLKKNSVNQDNGQYV